MSIFLHYDKINHKLIQISMLIKKMKNIKRDDIEEHSIKGLTKEDYELLILLVLGINLRGESNKKYANQKSTLYESIQAFLKIFPKNDSSSIKSNNKKEKNIPEMKNDLSGSKINKGKNKVNQIEGNNVEKQENNQINNLSDKPVL